MCGNTSPAKSQRLPKNPTNGQVPKWSDTQRAWVAATESAAGVNAYLYIAYADDSNGNGFTSQFNPLKNFIAIKHTSEPITPIAGDFTGLWFNYKGANGNSGNNGINGLDGKDGQSAFVYIGYADNERGDGLSDIFDPSKKFIAIRHTTWELDTQDPETFAGYWVKYRGDDGAAGLNGLNGQSAFIYIGYADDGAGNGFTTIFNPNKNYIAIKHSLVALSPVQSTFNGLWYNYKGQPGFPGTNGSDGANGVNGQSAYLYIAYADSTDGTGFTSEFDSSKNFIAILNTTHQIDPNDMRQYEGRWVEYRSNTLFIERQNLTENITFTPIHDKYYLFNPNGVERKVYLNPPPVSIKFTIKNIEQENEQAKIVIYDLEGNPSKMLSMGEAFQILYDKAANTWEVL